MKRDYTQYSFRITSLVIIILLAVSFIPSFSIGGVRIKRANILSDIFKFGDELAVAVGKGELGKEDQAFVEELDRLEEEMAAALAASAPGETGDIPAVNTGDWNLGEGFNDDFAPADGAGNDGEDKYDVGRGVLATNASELDAQERFEGVVTIEDFTEEGRPTVADFCALLGTATAHRTVRIAFLGDSFIEGDILTADVRSQLQQAYGGGGVGFVPFSTPLAQNRPTIKHTAGGWTNHNLIKKKSVPERAKERFFVSGIVSEPSGKAWAKYENTNFRARLGSVGAARLLFTNTGSSEIRLTVNDTIVRAFTPATSEEPQIINASGVNIQTLRVDISDPAGFYGYGVWLESGRGVGVDNYSIRSNSGLALSGTSAAVNMHIDRMVGYDMIVLQYGLNAMDPEVTKYTSYGQQMRRVVNYIKSCFPNSVIVVMAVGDRSTLRGGEYVTIPGVKGMVAEQRAVAQDCGVAFWNTYAAMGGQGSMSRYVKNGWAAKDYTHLSFGGGRQIATEFVRALEYEKYRTEGSATVEPEDLRPSGYLGVGGSLSLEEDAIPETDERIGPDVDSTALEPGMSADNAGIDADANEMALRQDSIPHSVREEVETHTEEGEMTWRDLDALIEEENVATAETAQPEEDEQ